MGSRGRWFIKNLEEVRAAKERLPAMFKPQKQPNGKWTMAKYSALAIARLKRKTLQSGKPWPYDVPRKEVERERMFKGHKTDREAAARRERVKQCMERMPEMIAAYRKARKENKKEKREGIALLLTKPRNA